MKTYSAPNPRLTTRFDEAVFDCEDAGVYYLLEGREVGHVQFCGTSDGYRHGYGVTVEIPGRPNVFYVNYDFKTYNAARDHCGEKLVEFGIL